jgi:DNA mismatch repair protein MSH5
MASIGALLDHLVRERAVSDLEDDGIGGLEVRDIEVLSLYVYPLLHCHK